MPLGEHERRSSSFGGWNTVLNSRFTAIELVGVSV